MTKHTRRLAVLAGALALVPASAQAQEPAPRESQPFGGSLALHRTDGVDVVSWYRSPGDRLALVRGGAEVAAAHATEQGEARLDHELATGDVVVVSRDGVDVHRQTYGGRPTIDAAACGGATAFAGDLDEGASYVHASAYPPHGSDYAAGDRPIRAQVAREGGRYTAALARAVPAGYDLFVASSGYDAQTGVYLWSALERKAGPCPEPAVAAIAGTPAPPKAPVKDLTPPAGVLPKGKLLPERGGLGKLLSPKGVESVVVVSEPGTVVVQKVVLDNGAKLTAAAAKRRPKQVVLASARKVAAKAGAVKLRLKATKAARKLRRKRVLKVAVVTTLTDPAGNVRRLPVKRQKVRR